MQVACKGHGRQEGTQKRKAKKSKHNKQRIISYNANIQEAQDNRERKARARTRNAPPSEIKMNGEGRGDSNQIK